MTNLDSYKNFGEFLATKRDERDFTLRELARQLGVSAPFLSDVEKNRSAPLTKDRLDNILRDSVRDIAFFAQLLPLSKRN